MLCQQIFGRCGVGSSVVINIVLILESPSIVCLPGAVRSGRVAQWREHWPPKPKAAGSSPVAPIFLNSSQIETHLTDR